MNQPKDPRQYKGESYEGRKCPKHRVLLEKDDHECCSCCCGGDCEPVYKCPKCEENYRRALNKWYKTWCHFIATGSQTVLKSKPYRTFIPGANYVIRIVPHNGKPLPVPSIGRFSTDGTLKPARAKKLGKDTYLLPDDCFLVIS